MAQTPTSPKSHLKVRAPHHDPGALLWVKVLLYIAIITILNFSTLSGKVAWFGGNMWVLVYIIILTGMFRQDKYCYINMNFKGELAYSYHMMLSHALK